MLLLVVCVNIFFLLLFECKLCLTLPLLKLICAVVILKANKSVSGLHYNYYTSIFLSKMKKGSSLKIRCRLTLYRPVEKLVYSIIDVKAFLTLTSLFPKTLKY